MKKLFFALVALALISCSDSQNAQKSQESNFYTQLNSEYLAQISQNSQNKDSQNAQNQPTDEQIAQDAQSLISRANVYGYKLIDAKSLSGQISEFNIIAVMPRGIYNLGLIPGAKHFAFAKSMTFKTDGSQWSWEDDALNRAQSEFVAFLGADKEAKILFYDEGDDVSVPAGRAFTAILWAQHLGYKNVYMLVGGFGAWKSLNFEVTQQIPECCKL